VSGIVGLSGRITGNAEVVGITTEALVEVLVGEPFFHEKTEVEGWLLDPGDVIGLHDVADIALAIERIMGCIDGAQVVCAVQENKGKNNEVDKMDKWEYFLL